MTFVDKNNQNDAGFTLTLSQQTEYDQMVKAAAKYLELEPTYLQFYLSYREAPGVALRCTYDGTLKDLLIYFPKMFYQKLAIPIREFQKSKTVTPTTTDAEVRKPTRPPGAKLPSSQTQPAKSTKKSFTGKIYLS